MNTHMSEVFYWLRYISVYEYPSTALATIFFVFGGPIGYVRLTLVYLVTVESILVVC